MKSEAYLHAIPPSAALLAYNRGPGAGDRPSSCLVERRVSHSNIACLVWRFSEIHL